MTWALIVVNAALFLYTLYLPVQDVQSLFYLRGLVPARFAYPDWAAQIGYPADDYSPYLTSMFLHSGWLHLISNIWLLWIFGDNVEDRMGSVRFLVFYLLCGLVAGIMQIYFMPESNIPTIGASGAIAGVMGAYFFLYPRARLVIWVFFLPLFVQVPAIAFLGIWVLIQMYKATNGLSAAGHMHAEVAWWGHLGGFITGMLAYQLFLLNSRLPVDETDEPSDPPT